MLDENKLRKAMDNYGDMLMRYCLFMLKDHADAEDAVEDTFIVYFKKYPGFSDEGHEKAWLITVAVNKCRDILRYRKRHQTEPEELFKNYPVPDEDKRILEALAEVPEKYRQTLSLHYIEGFKVREIADIMKLSESAVKMRLSKGRKLLEEIYRKEYL